MPAAPVAHHATSTGRAGTVQRVVLRVPSGDTVTLVHGGEVLTVTTTQGRYVLDAATHQVSFTPVAGYVGTDGLDVRSDLGGLNLSDVPKVLIETGNMRNATDAGRLESASYRQREALALARAIEQFAG